MQIKESVFKVIVKPNAKKTELLCYDKENNAYRISVAAIADKDKANKELLRFLRKEFKKKVKIKSGQKSRIKLIETI